MAHVQMDFFSQALQVGSSIDLILPEAAAGAIGIDSQAADDPPVLYLLHGLSDDHTIWMRRTSIERYAAQYGLAVVMPAVGRSFYADMVSGPAYWSYLSEELPALVERCFRVGTGKEKTFVAGLSMGGYGAMKCALSFPERFAAVGAFSGSLDLGFRLDKAAEGGLDDLIARDIRLAFGDPPRLRPEDDLVELARRAAGRLDLPATYIACGSEDFLFDANERYHALLTELGIDHEYTVEPGIHEWGFWDRHIERFFVFCAGRGVL